MLWETMICQGNRIWRKVQVSALVHMKQHLVFLLTLPDQANVNIEMQLFRLALLDQIVNGIRVPLLID